MGEPSSSSSVSFYLKYFFAVGLSQIFMKLGMNDTRIYRVTKLILNICIHYANYVKGANKTQWSYFSSLVFDRSRCYCHDLC